MRPCACWTKVQKNRESEVVKTEEINLPDALNKRIAVIAGLTRNLLESRDAVARHGMTD